MKNPSPQQIVKALQYLYYTGDGINRLKGTPISDRNYDLFCESNGIKGNGGSDRERDYMPADVALAEKISKEGIVL